MASSLSPIEVPVVAKFINPSKPSVGRIVHYRLSHQDIDAANRRRDHARSHLAEHRENSNGVQVHVGNHHRPGDIVPLLVVRVWPDEYKTDSSFCRDVIPGQEYEWTFPKSAYGINGQAFLDGNDTLWITSAPQAEANGCWDWPERVA